MAILLHQEPTCEKNIEGSSTLSAEDAMIEAPKGGVRGGAGGGSEEAACPLLAWVFCFCGAMRRIIGHTNMRII